MLTSFPDLAVQVNTNTDTNTNTFPNLDTWPHPMSGIHHTSIWVLHQYMNVQISEWIEHAENRQRYMHSILSQLQFVLFDAYKLLILSGLGKTEQQAFPLHASQGI